MTLVNKDCEVFCAHKVVLGVLGRSKEDIIAEDDFVSLQPEWFLQIPASVSEQTCE